MASIASQFLVTFLEKKNFDPSREVTPLRCPILFFLFFILFSFSIFSLFLVLLGKCVFLFFFLKKCRFQHLYWCLTKDVSSVVGAPWRCGVLTTSGGIAGIGLGRLLEGEQ